MGLVPGRLDCPGARDLAGGAALGPGCPGPGIRLLAGQRSQSPRAKQSIRKHFPTSRWAATSSWSFTATATAPPTLQRDRQFIADTIEPGLRQIAREEGGLAGEVKPSDGPLFGEPEKPPPKTAAAVGHRANSHPQRARFRGLAGQPRSHGVAGGHGADHRVPVEP